MVQYASTTPRRQRVLPGYNHNFGYGTAPNNMNMSVMSSMGNFNYQPPPMGYQAPMQYGPRPSPFLWWRVALSTHLRFSSVQTTAILSAAVQPGLRVWLRYVDYRGGATLVGLHTNLASRFNVGSATACGVLH